ncbi:MAG: HAD-IIIA family hydrolase [Alphaproteobacteria bacterium]|nr:HAD-IIIA family hydrolase [Alphaproteobacteria bacterium]
MQTVILAGGKGTRLGARAADRPKALVEIAGTTLVEHQLSILRRYGLERVLILTGHLGEQIEARLGDGAAMGMRISYMREPEPLGTAGAVRAAAPLLEENFFVVYGDIVFDMDMDRLAEFHAVHNAVATLAVHPNDHPYDSDLVDVDANGVVRALYRKDRHAGLFLRNLVNTGIFAMRRDIIDAIPRSGAHDFGLDVIPALLAKGAPVAAYRTPEYIKDAGTLDRLSHVEHDILRGEVARRNLVHPRPAVFLDRDGVINREIGENYRPEQMELLPGVGEAIRRINKSGYLAVAVTNQPGIAKGFLTEADVEAAHARIETLLGQERAYLDDVLYCPHHPERGFAGERLELKIACECRKPRAGLLRAAAGRYNIDLSRSLMVGDRTADLAAAREAGVKAVLVRTGYGGSDGKYAVEPDLIFDDLEAAVTALLANNS